MTIYSKRGHSLQSYYENKSPSLCVTAKDGVDISRPTKVFIYGGALTTSTSVEVRFDLRRILTDAGSLGAFLCQDCLNMFSNYTYKPDKIQEIAVINLLTKELRPLEENCPWFTFDNYIVNLDFEDDGRVDIDIIYRPLRYEGPEE